ncbi:PREDICTED: protein piccolo-like [Cyprinodon variegatus]|uniref:protein piccolo-like n=1 Tax=Cyprinodon variegatus TaxID=28743 RepID=UPI0007426832|nr:PREDICTED: protein piccolo-like [Cyprinodon variegatus]
MWGEGSGDTATPIHLIPASSPAPHPTHGLDHPQQEPPQEPGPTHPAQAIQPEPPPPKKTQKNASTRHFMPLHPTFFGESRGDSPATGKPPRPRSRPQPRPRTRWLALPPGPRLRAAAEDQGCEKTPILPMREGMEEADRGEAHKISPPPVVPPFSKSPSREGGPTSFTTIARGHGTGSRTHQPAGHRADTATLPPQQGPRHGGTPEAVTAGADSRAYTGPDPKQHSPQNPNPRNPTGAPAQGQRAPGIPNPRTHPRPTPQ